MEGTEMWDENSARPPINMAPERTLLGWLIRHGELKNMHVWDGWGDFELSEEGRIQAAKAAQWLSYEHIGRVVSSDVPRTMQTAQYLMDTGCVECPFMACDSNLRPWMVSGYTGKEKTAKIGKRGVLAFSTPFINSLL